MSGYDIYIFLEKKMAKLLANSGDPDRILRHLIRICTVCQLPFYSSPDYNGLIHRIVLIISKDFSLTVTVVVLIENHYQTVTLISCHDLPTTRLVTSGKQRPVDVDQVECSLVPVHDGED